MQGAGRLCRCRRPNGLGASEPPLVPDPLPSRQPLPSVTHVGLTSDARIRLPAGSARASHVTMPHHAILQPTSTTCTAALRQAWLAAAKPGAHPCSTVSPPPFLAQPTSTTCTAAASATRASPRSRTCRWGLVNTRCRHASPCLQAVGRRMACRVAVMGGLMNLKRQPQQAK